MRVPVPGAVSSAMPRRGGASETGPTRGEGREVSRVGQPLYIRSDLIYKVITLYNTLYEL
jgi:hypothetical protein